jgi:hypothetical protein
MEQARNALGQAGRGSPSWRLLVTMPLPTGGLLDGVWSA